MPEFKYSENVAVVPLNAKGAVELGLHPCQYCKVGWGSYSAKESKSCGDTCEWLKQFIDLTSKKVSSNIKNAAI